MNTACSAYREGQALCANGFTQNSACMGAVCHTCGCAPPKSPVCMKDEVPERLVDDAGKPKFALLGKEGE